MKKVPVTPVQDFIVQPKGARLNLVPVLDRFFITSPDAGQEEANKVGGIHLPQGSQLGSTGYALVEVGEVGPLCKFVTKGSRILVVRPQCNKVVYDGNEYWFTSEPAIMGIVKS